jgi:hypothetical protein
LRQTSVPAFLAVATTPARDVKRHRDQVTLPDEFNAAAAFDDFAGNLMPEDQSGRRRGAPADHVLVAAADVGRDRLDDDAVVDFPFLRRLQFRIVDALYLDLARPEINHSVIGSHKIFSFAGLSVGTFPHRGAKIDRTFCAVNERVTDALNPPLLREAAK